MLSPVYSPTSNCVLRCVVFIHVQFPGLNPVSALSFSWWHSEPLQMPAVWHDLPVAVRSAQPHKIPPQQRETIQLWLLRIQVWSSAEQSCMSSFFLTAHTLDIVFARCKNMIDLRKHLDTHSSEPAFRCDVTGCSFTSRALSTMKIHHKRDHEVKTFGVIHSLALAHGVYCCSLFCDLSFP